MVPAIAVVKWRVNVSGELLEGGNANLPLMLSTILGIILIAFCVSFGRISQDLDLGRILF